MNIIIGIDPGFTGAMVALEATRSGARIIGVLDAPVFDARVKSLDGVTVANFFRTQLATHVAIEKVGPRPHDGAKRSFDFGAGYGVYLGVIAALTIPSHLTPPGTWKKAMGLSADKRLSRQLATQLWPDARDPDEPAKRGLFARVKDDGRAEAALIAEYRRRQLAQQHAL